MLLTKWPDTGLKNVLSGTLPVRLWQQQQQHLLTGLWTEGTLKTRIGFAGELLLKASHEPLTLYRAINARRNYSDTLSMGRQQGTREMNFFSLDRRNLAGSASNLGVG